MMMVVVVVVTFLIKILAALPAETEVRCIFLGQLWWWLLGQ
jgi:hypothetical protein